MIALWPLHRFMNRIVTNVLSCMVISPPRRLSTSQINSFLSLDNIVMANWLMTNLYGGEMTVNHCAHMIHLEPITACVIISCMCLLTSRMCMSREVLHHQEHNNAGYNHSSENDPFVLTRKVKTQSQQFNKRN